MFSKMILARQLFVTSSFCLSFLSIILSMSSFLTAYPDTARSIRTVDNEIVLEDSPLAHVTPIAWCILDDTNSNPRHFRHFPHASQSLIPCWSYFSRVRERIPDARCGFWLDSDKLKLSKGWVADLVATMNCVVVADTQPVNVQISLRPKKQRQMTKEQRQTNWFQIPSDARRLRDKVVGPRFPSSRLRIGLVQRIGSWIWGNRNIRNLPDIQSSIEQAFPTATVEIACMERMSFVQQAEWWSRQDVVVAAHGASMTNLIFMENASVIELYPDHYYPMHFYSSLSESVGISHYGWYNGVADPEADYRQHCRTVDDRNFYRNVDLTPPVEQVLELVRRALDM
jgi:hypothetical protein